MTKYLLWKRGRPFTVHELSLCQHLLDQVTVLATAHGAREVERIVLQIGPLAGVEISLLAQAFSIARAGTLAENAELDIEPAPIRVRCQTCGAETEASPAHLACGRCGDWRTELVSGDQLVLASLQLTLEEDHV